MSDEHVIEFLNPEGWKQASGYSNGVLAPAGARLLCVAGQIAWDADQQLVGRGDFVAQFRQALENVAAVVRAAGGAPEHVIEVTIYVTDKRAYLADLRALGAAWRAVLGKHFPAMALVEVAGLLEDGAQVEIQARAALP